MNFVDYEGFKEFVLNNLQDDSGASYWIEYGLMESVPTEGYLVGLYGITFPLATLKQAEKSDICFVARSFISNMIDGLLKLAHADDYGEVLGVWVDSGIVYIDVVCHYYSIKNAVELAAKWEQKAIFDLKEGCAIDMTDTLELLRRSYN